MECLGRLALIIPAHNEEQRIGTTLKTYHDFFDEHQAQLDVELIVVLNGCTDNTMGIVTNLQQSVNSIKLLNIAIAGKGYAITQGFNYALTTDADIIGFVDADMATAPHEFYRLLTHMKESDGIIASRYMKGSIVTPPRPFIKRWGSRIVFEPLVRMTLGISYNDLQCGAKVFKRNVIEKTASHMQIRQWAFDVELLYLCKLCGFSIKEIPTIWHDQALSKLKTFRGGIQMLRSIIDIRKIHKSLRNNIITLLMIVLLSY